MPGSGKSGRTTRRGSGTRPRIQPHLKEFLQVTNEGANTARMDKGGHSIGRQCGKKSLPVTGSCPGQLGDIPNPPEQKIFDVGRQVVAAGQNLVPLGQSNKNHIEKGSCTLLGLPGR